MNGVTTMQTGRCLNEEQMMRLLERPSAGALPSGAEFLVQQHLEGCAVCRDEVAELRSALGIYREATTSYAAAAYAETRSTLRPAAEPSRWRGMVLWPVTLAAAACACGVAMSVSHHPGAAVPNKAATTASVQGAGVASESDERLLEGIDQDLSASVPPSLAPLTTATAAGSGTAGSGTPGSGTTGLNQN